MLAENKLNENNEGDDPIEQMCSSPNLPFDLIQVLEVASEEMQEQDQRDRERAIRSARKTVANESVELLKNGYRDLEFGEDTQSINRDYFEEELVKMGLKVVWPTIDKSIVRIILPNQEEQNKKYKLDLYDIISITMSLVSLVFLLFNWPLKLLVLGLTLGLFLSPLLLGYFKKQRD